MLSPSVIPRVPSTKALVTRGATPQILSSTRLLLETMKSLYRGRGLPRRSCLLLVVTRRRVHRHPQLRDKRSSPHRRPLIVDVARIRMILAAPKTPKTRMAGKFGSLKRIPKALRTHLPSLIIAVSSMGDGRGPLSSLIIQTRFLSSENRRA